MNSENNISRNMEVLKTKGNKPSMSISFRDIKNIDNEFDEKSVKAKARFNRKSWFEIEKEKKENGISS